RHTIFSRDWSSDVCSSDLRPGAAGRQELRGRVVSATLRVPCAHCGALNQVPAARLADGPGCGRCHRRLFEGRPVELRGGNFELQDRKCVWEVKYGCTKRLR